MVRHRAGDRPRQRRRHRAEAAAPARGAGLRRLPALARRPGDPAERRLRPRQPAGRGPRAEAAAQVRRPGADPGREREMEEALGRDRARPGEVMSERLDPARTCLLLFDFLAGHVERDRSRYRPVIANAAALLAAARSAGAMVAHAHADHRADLGTTARTLRDTDNRLQPVNAQSHKPVIVSGSPEARIVDELAPRDAE